MSGVLHWLLLLVCSSSPNTCLTARTKSVNTHNITTELFPKHLPHRLHKVCKHTHITSSVSSRLTVTICISYVLFFRATSKYAGHYYHLHLLRPLLQGSLKVCRMLWGKGSCYQLDPNTQDSKTKKKKAQNHSQQPGTSTTYHQSLQGPEHQWECSSTALCASVWRSQTPSSAESTTTTTKRSCI